MYKYALYGHLIFILCAAYNAAADTIVCDEVTEVMARTISGANEAFFPKIQKPEKPDLRSMTDYVQGELGQRVSVKAEPVNDYSGVVVRDLSGTELASFTFTVNGDNLDLGIAKVLDDTNKGKGIYELMMAKILDDNPNIKTVEGFFSDDNERIFQEAVKKGLNCEEALRAIPAVKMRIRFGFTTIVDKHCAWYRPGITMSR